MVEQLQEFLSYDFVRNALVAGSIAAVLGGVIGYFVLLRQVAFAAHALAHIGFTGATGAALFGLTPFQGMLGIALVSGGLMGAYGTRLSRNEMAIGMTLSFALALGTLFLSLYKGFSGQAAAILFGNIFGVSSTQVATSALLAGASLALLGLFSRRLLFASLQPALAEARGLPTHLLGIAFLMLLGVSVTIASQVVGILLVFTLVIGPAGMALRVCRGFWSGIGSAVGIGLLSVWIGILLACFTNWPPSFCIPLLLFVLSLFTELTSRLVLKTER